MKKINLLLIILLVSIVIMLLIILLVSIVIISGCAQSDKNQVDSAKPSQLYDSFTQKLANCEMAGLKVKAGGTNDIYSVDILGLKNNNCEIKLTFEKAGKQATKVLECLSATCSQKWKDEFNEIAQLNGTESRDYVNNLLINMVLDMKKQDSLCAGKLRDKILEVGK